MRFDLVTTILWGALATNLLEADVLVILTDQDGFFDKDPRFHADAALIPEGAFAR